MKEDSPAKAMNQKQHSFLRRPLFVEVTEEDRIPLMMTRRKDKQEFKQDN